MERRIAKRDQQMLEVIRQTSSLQITSKSLTVQEKGAIPKSVSSLKLEEPLGESSPRAETTSQAPPKSRNLREKQFLEKTKMLANLQALTRENNPRHLHLQRMTPEMSVDIFAKSSHHSTRTTITLSCGRRYLRLMS